MPGTPTFYVSIGNSDDALPQARWSTYHSDVDAAIRDAADVVHGAWVSDSVSPYQNACWAFEPRPESIHHLRSLLARIARLYSQWGITWAAARVDFIGPM